MIPLPQPFLVVPLDGSDPVHVHEWHQSDGPPILGVALVTPYIAQKWLHAGPFTDYPVVIKDADEGLVAGQAALRDISATGTTPAAIVNIPRAQADTAVTAVVAMRQVYEAQAESSGDIEALILSEDGGRVLGGAGSLHELRKPRTMLVLILPSPTDEDGRLAAAPTN